jgi:hypothetical protein
MRSIQTVTSLSYTPSITFTRPANTTDYTAGDVVGVADVSVAANAGSAIHALTDAGPVGGEILITGCDLYIHAGTALTDGTTYRLELYDASPTAILDNAAYDLVAGDRTKHLCSIDIAAPTDKGATLVSQNNQLQQQVQLATGSSTLYALLVDVGGSTPTSALVYKLRLRTVAL